MAASFWRWMIGGVVAADALLAGILAGMWSWPIGVSLLAAVAVLSIASSMLLTIALGMASIANRDADGGGPRRRRDWLRTALTEPVAFGRTLVAMITVRRGRWIGFDESRIACIAPPVLLIHGIVCNRGVWREWFEPLRAAGFACVRVIDLEPLFSSIDGYAADVVAELRRMQRDSGGGRVVIVGHSMGGLVARAALRVAGPELIAGIVTIGSPHHGTAWARIATLPPATQMRRDSAWLDELNRCQEGRLSTPVTSIYSMQDEFIVPARSAVLSGAQNHELRGVGHLGLLASAECVHLTLAALGRP